MRHYRVNKLAKPDGVIVKSKDVLASDEREAADRARNELGCPVCEIWHAGQKVASL